MKTFYRRHLPHYHPPYADFFITFRIFGSLPKTTILRLKHEYEVNKKSLIKKFHGDDLKSKIIENRKYYFGKFDSLLDNIKTGNFWLANDRIAGIIAETIKAYDDIEYDLKTFCIMPNHVHLVISNVERSASSTNHTRLVEVLRKIKGPTAREANKILNRNGAFWQHESFDHVIRNNNEMERVIRYVLNNPVKAGLIKKWTDWKWTHCKYMNL